MSNIILTDLPEVHENLLPLTFTRPSSDLQTGILTIESKWRRLLPGDYHHHTVSYLQAKYPALPSVDADTLTIANHIVPDETLAAAVAALKPGQALVKGALTIASRGCEMSAAGERIEYTGEIDVIELAHNLFSRCGKWLEADFRSLTAGRQSAPLSDSCTLIGPRENLFIEEGAQMEGAILNTTGGPIYIGRDAGVMEGSCLRGPIAILDHAKVNMCTRIYGPTVIGAWCKVGGELNNVVMHPYTNKAHDGFLGNAVIGSWCNLGAGCTASNLKNDYTEIKLWNYPSRRFLRTGLQFCGLIMGDHSKAGINTMFNTATTVGVGVNIHGTGFPRNFVASFSEGSATAGFTDVSLSKFCQIAERVMARRGITFTEADRSMFDTIREIAESYK